MVASGPLCTVFEKPYTGGRLRCGELLGKATKVVGRGSVRGISRFIQIDFGEQVAVITWGSGMARTQLGAETSLCDSFLI